MNNIYVLNKSYKKIGTLSNQGANPQAPYYEDLYTQELETGADTYQFSTTSSKYTQDILEIGNHIMFAYKNRNELFTITSLEYSHYEGYKTIGVYAEGIGFDLLEIYMKRPENEKDEGGRDEDNDGDTSTDDEYADLDDMYLDENGIIVYDKDGSGPPKEEDMYVDENGIIVYRRNKRNREKDSLEFKNISYSRFLSILLKNTGWSYVCQPGLESVKHDITVRYDTNIFALLQDSMQSYRGVELEFVHELVGGRVQKVIKAYKDGGRGSFVGKRFEYGTNVRGITKMQEVANSEDDTVLYVDNVGIAVQYDVDFALKSAEVPEIEIGDTHYVIDRDFCPPMQIKARIGKIEISFSDPTKNKIYLANNKKISGSAIEDEFGADDVADMLDDYDDGPVSDHYHCELVSSGDTDGLSDKIGFYVGGFGPDSPEAASKYYLGFSHAPWYMLWVDNIECYHVIRAEVGMVTPELIVNGNIYLRGQIIYQNDGEGEEGGSGVESVFDALHVNYDLTVGEDTDEYTRTHLTSRSVSAHFAYITERLETDTIYVDRIRFSDGTSLTTAGSGGSNSGNPGGGTITDGFDIVSGNELFVNKIDAIAIEAAKVEVTNRLYAKDIVATSISQMTTAEINAIKTGIIDVGVKAKIKEIEFSDGTTMTTANGTGTGGGTGGCIFEKVTTSEGDTFYYTDNDIQIERDLYVNGTLHINSGDGIGMGIVDCDILEVTEIKFPDGTILTSANGSGAGGTTPGGGSSGSSPSYDSENDKITVSNAQIGPTYNPSIDNPNNYRIPINPAFTVNGDMLLIGRLYIIGTWYCNGNEYSDKSLKENIRYIDNTGAIIVDKENLETRDYSKEELLEKTDLYDFIVNQVNICEYNFIDDNDNRKKIGFIANEYEGTKVGDKIVNRDKETDLLGYDPNNLLFATIGALQEEVRTRDEQIASLEARLAKIETMLGINN